jgi:hypothetical protein
VQREGPHTCSDRLTLRCEASIQPQLRLPNDKYNLFFIVARWYARTGADAYETKLDAAFHAIREFEAHKMSRVRRDFAEEFSGRTRRVLAARVLFLLEQEFIHPTLVVFRRDPDV